MTASTDRPTRNVRRLHVSILAVVIGTLVIAAQARATVCGPFNGSFVAQFDSDIPGPPYPPGYAIHCPTSTMFPVRQCTHGQLFEAGEQVATYEFGFTSQTPGLDGVVRFTGVSEITMLSTGDVISGRDHGYLVPDPAADGQAASFETTVEPYEVMTAKGDTRPLRTAADTPGNPNDVSRIVAGPEGTGSLNLLNGTSSGDYVGQICPKL